MKRDFEVDEEEAGSRLETYLRRRLGLPRALALKALRKGWIRVDGSRAKPSRRLVLGQVIRVTNYGLPLNPPSSTPPTRAVPSFQSKLAEKSIRYADPLLLVSAKPAGEVVHRGSGHALGWIDKLGAALKSQAPIPIGRLDRDTSGLLVLARSRLAARRLFQSLREGKLSKTYSALLSGALEGDKGTIELPLLKRGNAGQEQMRVDPQGRPARTHYQVRERFLHATLVDVTLETGRTHQIRAHFAALGHPLLGDPRYTGEQGPPLPSTRLFLHAGRCAFPHPRSAELLEFSEELPPDLQRVLSKLETRAGEKN